MAQTGKDITYAATLLKEGHLVAIPTETVYGLAGNAWNEDAILKIFEAKNRPRFNPLIVHVASVNKIKELVSTFSPLAELFAEKFMPGPLTLLLPKKEIIPDLVTAGSNLVAVRIPDHSLTLQLLQLIEFPLAAPSANPFGYISPTKAEHVLAQLGEKVSYVLDGGDCEIGIESTICGFDADQNPVIYRQGKITAEELEQVSGRKVLLAEKNSETILPGTLLMHYAPATPLVLGNIKELLKQYSDKKTGILSFSKNFGVAFFNIVLSENGDLSVAARHLFSSLRMLDGKKLDIILAEEVPDVGIGRAINDRLRRAATKKISV